MTCSRLDPRFFASLPGYRVRAALSLLTPLLLAAGCKCSGDPGERAAGGHQPTPAYVAVDSAPVEKVNVEPEAPGPAAGATHRDGGSPMLPRPPTVPNPNDLEKARLEKENTTRSGVCENILRDMQASRSPSSADIATVGYTDRVEFEKHLVHERRLLVCNAVRLGSETACQLFPDSNERERCVRETAFYMAARRAPADTSWRFPDSLMGDCTRIPKMDAASCAQFRDAVRGSKAGDCPKVDADVNSFCRALASLDAKQCPSSRFDGCASEIARAQPIAKSGLQGLIDLNDKDKALASAALGTADACDSLAKEWLEACRVGQEKAKGKGIKGPAPAPAR